MSCCDEALAQGFADCEALVVAMLTQMADTAQDREGCASSVSHMLRSAALAVSLGQHRSAKTNDLAVLSAHRTAVNRAQAQAAGRASAAKRWGPKGAKP
jgi:hypothetical protein